MEYVFTTFTLANRVRIGIFKHTHKKRPVHLRIALPDRHNRATATATATAAAQVNKKHIAIRAAAVVAADRAHNNLPNPAGVLSYIPGKRNENTVINIHVRCPMPEGNK